jgi:hypothetical protein
LLRLCPIRHKVRLFHLKHLNHSCRSSLHSRCQLRVASALVLSSPHRQDRHHHYILCNSYAVQNASHCLQDQRRLPNCLGLPVPFRFHRVHGSSYGDLDFVLCDILLCPALLIDHLLLHLSTEIFRTITIADFYAVFSVCTIFTYTSHYILGLFCCASQGASPDVMRN